MVVTSDLDGIEAMEAGMGDGVDHQRRAHALSHPVGVDEQRIELQGGSHHEPGREADDAIPVDGHACPPGRQVGD